MVGSKKECSWSSEGKKERLGGMKDRTEVSLVGHDRVIVLESSFFFFVFF